MSKHTLIALFATIIIFSVPHAIIWALNTLFHTNIGYGFCEWLSVLILCAAFSRPSVYRG
jgi:hypothetical protein